MTIQPGDPQPIVSSTESWHLARAIALRDVCALIADATGPGALATVREAVEQGSEQAFAEYFAYVGAPQSVQEHRAQVRAHVDANINVPVASWPEVDATARDTWAFLDMPSDNDPAPFVLTAPFRPVQLARLPEGSISIPIMDPRHSASAAMVEALECARRDVASAFLAHDEGIAWRRLNQLIGVYREASKVVRKTLRDDDFVSWASQLPSRIALEHAVNLITQIGATARAHEMLAFHVVSHWLQALADRAERRAPTGTRKQYYQGMLEEALTRQQRFLAPLNHHALEGAGCDPARTTVQVVFRPLPGAGPLLVAIPASQDTVTQFPVRQSA